MLPSYLYLSKSALSDFTNIVTRKFPVLKKLTCIAYCAVKIRKIFVICLDFSRVQMKGRDEKSCLPSTEKKAVVDVDN